MMSNHLARTMALLLLTMGVGSFSLGNDSTNESYNPHGTVYECQFLLGRWQVYKTIDLSTDDIAYFPMDERGTLEAYWASKLHTLLTSMGNSLINYIMGKEFEFAKNYVSINGIKYKDPSYELMVEEPITFLYARFRIGEAEKLGIHVQEGVEERINTIEVSLYIDKEKSKDRKPMPIPFPSYEAATFYVERLIMYKGEMIMPFSIRRKNDKKGYYHHSFLRYLCLRKID